MVTLRFPIVTPSLASYDDAMENKGEGQKGESGLLPAFGKQLALKGTMSKLPGGPSELSRRKAWCWWVPDTQIQMELVVINAPSPSHDGYLTQCSGNYKMLWKIESLINAKYYYEPFLPIHVSPS